jgi:Flp pilus assembly protein TadD
MTAHFWGQSLTMRLLAGWRPQKARAYADSALALSKSQADENPNDAQLQVLYGVVLAAAGKATEARQQLAQGVALGPTATTQSRYIRLNGARIETILGDKARAPTSSRHIRKEGGLLTRSGWS